MNRQPLNVELLTLDDGTQKIAWDVKQLQALFGISHQDTSHDSNLVSVAPTSAVPTIETVIALLDEMGFKDLYEVRYRKQYATIIPRTNAKRPKVALYVVQQQSDLALSIHDRIWFGHRLHLCWDVYEDGYGALYIPIVEMSEFVGRFDALVGEEVTSFLSLDERIAWHIESDSLLVLPYSKNLEYWQKLIRDFGEFIQIPKYQDSPTVEYFPVIKDMIKADICYEIDSDQRFPSTARISLSDYESLKKLILELRENIASFLTSNGEKPHLDFEPKYEDVQDRIEAQTHSFFFKEEEPNVNSEQKYDDIPF
ncbi:hypothetical protein [Tumidithrix helvetica]|uniref:hypothetical protein n=1 Tax=Tumidithrix helvetica TaxID=3457545 RepID=UPI003CC67E3D